MTSPTVYTIGHSTHPIETFIGMLEAYDVETLVDIRTIPASRRHPQFAQKNLAKELAAEGMYYVHMKDLGGLRRPAKDSRNSGWRNASFRGYADYMETASFQTALDALVALAGRTQVAIMCAEAVPWRCHRSLVGDALTVRGVAVVDIFSEDKAVPHKLTPFAHVERGRLTYPAEQGRLL